MIQIDDKITSIIYNQLTDTDKSMLESAEYAAKEIKQFLGTEALGKARGNTFLIPVENHAAQAALKAIESAKILLERLV
jgi:hypothetical protein